MMTVSFNGFVKLACELKTREKVVTLSGVGGPWTLLCTKI